MKEYTTGIKSAVIVIHQMFIVLMVCGLFGTGYVAQRNLQGMGLLMLLSVIGLVGSFVTLAYLTGISGRKSTDDPAIYLNMVDKVYTDVQMVLFIGFIYLMFYMGRGLRKLDFAVDGDYVDFVNGVDALDGGYVPVGFYADLYVLEVSAVAGGYVYVEFENAAGVDEAVADYGVFIAEGDGSACGAQVF